MFQADQLGAIKERVDQGEACDVHFGPCGSGAGEPRSRADRVQASRSCSAVAAATVAGSKVAERDGELLSERSDFRA